MRTAATTDVYRRRASALIRQAEKENHANRLNIFQLIAWFLAHHDTWAPATIRQYRAALSQLVSDAAEHRQLAESQRLSLIQNLRGRIDKNGRQIAPRAQRILRKPRKRRILPPLIARKLVQSLGNRTLNEAAQLGRLIVVAGVEIGVRPCEWKDLQVYDGYCRVQNAKNTNNRANGPERIIHITPGELGTRVSAVVQDIIRQISISDSWNSMQRRVNHSLKRASQEIGLQHPVTLSTLRHVAIARWKCLFSPDEVAALAGHASNATAIYHYGRRRSGKKWRPVLVKPHLPSVAVRNRFRSYRHRTISPTVL